ncbi:2OG-Fe(II) oxygenase [Parapedobacter sp. 10938]|uniref:2OG-Fe(II) oxygenase n=1 Tax=Parapedobacter flavus TaxID=3110225 RepID=UPI002DBDA28D|nr:2OG-Fe(II) oxygenase [Parapedobacter sp. 10938]MEC3881019.1 2OG-Fe(II) oxygenase [Parapedobacter sp. 10938]
MGDFEQGLLAALDEIKGSGSFVSSGSEPFTFPGLHLRGYGEIGFPIHERVCADLIALAHKAPFGKGSQTLVDANVRSAWEIDAEALTFVGETWDKQLVRILSQVKSDLGLEGHDVHSHLYKLLVYETGDFFVAHKDSEKEPGMFGTLIVGLPSEHTGGELQVSLGGKVVPIDFSDSVAAYRIPYAAFYADCTHEILPITSGYRVCLVYNLVHGKSAAVQQPESNAAIVHQIAKVLESATEDTDIPKIVLLGHQYTPSNFTMDTLKLADRPRAEALLAAAETAAFYAKLGLVTSYQAGELEIDTPPARRGRRRSYYGDDHYSDEELEEYGTMGEVYNEYVQPGGWMEGGIPPLRGLQFEYDDLIAAFQLNEGEPIEKDAEGYTGNAGMEMVYWYHYGAVFLWPKKHHIELLVQEGAVNQLEWLAYWNQRWDTLTDAEIAGIRKLLAEGLGSASYKRPDYSPLVDSLMLLGDVDFLHATGGRHLVDHFAAVGVGSLMRLIEAYPAYPFSDVCVAVLESGRIADLAQLLALLDRLRSSGDTHSRFIDEQLARLPEYLSQAQLTLKENHATVLGLLRHLSGLVRPKASDEDWMGRLVEALVTPLTRGYVNNVLMPLIVETDPGNPLVDRLAKVGHRDLAARVADKPQPPADWSRDVPTADRYGRVWALLVGFLQSPTEQLFDYRANQSERSLVETALANVRIDIKTETIRKGSPHTLRLTKTQEAYENALAKWEVDVDLLEQLDAIIMH